MLPRCLWVLTINALLPESAPNIPPVTITQESIVLDPLQVLRCDPRIYRYLNYLKVIKSFRIMLLFDVFSPSECLNFYLFKALLWAVTFLEAIWYMSKSFKKTKVEKWISPWREVFIFTLNVQIFSLGFLGFLL